MDPNEVLLQWQVHIVLIHRIKKGLAFPSCCGNREMKTRTYLLKLFCMDCFRYSLKFFIKSNNDSKLNFEVALNAQ